MTLPLHSGEDWESDPNPNANSHDGRTLRRDMRAKGDPARVAVVKRPQDRYLATEMYSIGMERVAYRLGADLGLPIPETWLDDVDGHPCSVQRKIVNAKTWLQLGSAPSMRDNVQNKDVYALAALFDVWMGNIDRRDMNFVFEPDPPAERPAMAKGSRMWLIDHGLCGLWPAWKVEANRDPADLPTDPTAITGELDPRAEAAIAFQMPPEYRMALKQSQGESRAALLDRIRSVGDDAIEHAVNEIPDAYMTVVQRHVTVAFLKARRDLLDTVIRQHWSG